MRDFTLFNLLLAWGPHGVCFGRREGRGEPSQADSNLTVARVWRSSKLGNRALIGVTHRILTLAQNGVHGVGNTRCP
jgi:hypothetical protein